MPAFWTTSLRAAAWLHVVAGIVGAQQLTVTTPLPTPGFIGARPSIHARAVASDGSGVVLALVRANDLDPQIGHVFLVEPTGSLWIARSLDGGETWEPLVRLYGPTAPLGLELGTGTRAALASDGDAFVAIWAVGPSEHFNFGELLVSRSTDAGATWSPAASLSLTTTTSREPSLAADADGTFVAVWQAPSDGYFDVFFARSADGGATWSAPAPFDPNAGTAVGLDVYPQVATDGAGTWLTVWGSTKGLDGTIGTDGDILFTRSVDDGITWSAPAPLDTAAATDTDSDFGPFVAVDASGAWIVAWTGDDSAHGNFVKTARSLDGGASWSAPVALAPPIPGALTFALRGVLGRPAEALVLYGSDRVAFFSRDAGASWEPLPIAYPKVDQYDRMFDHMIAAVGAGTWAIAGYATSDFLFMPSGLRTRAYISAARIALCGDGVIGGGESCEDGNTASGDGCSAACRVEGCWTCAGLPSVCTVGPRPVCKQPTAPRRSTLAYTDSPTDAKDVFTWKWGLGEATAFDDAGDPFGNDGYSFCLFDETGSPALVFAADAPPAGSCAGPSSSAKPCWTTKSVPFGATGVTYKDSLRTPDGLELVDLRFGPAGKAKITVRGKGALLPDGVLPVGAPLRAQLHGGNGGCFEATYASTGILVNDGAKLKAVSD